MAKAPPKNPRKRKTPAKALTLRGSKLADFEPLLPAEEKLRRCATRGEDCEVDGFNGKRPEKSTTKNKVRAAFLRYMILGGCEKSPVHARGINLYGAYVMCRDDGPNGKCLDLEAATINREMGLFDCHIDGSLILRSASAKNLYLTGSCVEEIEADWLETSSSIVLRGGFKASGEVRFIGAKLGGDLSCIGGIFEGREDSLSCDGLETKGDIFLNEGFKASGAVRLLGAKLGGDLSCIGGIFEGREDSLSCDRLETKGSIFLNEGFKASGAVRLLGAKLGGSLSCIGGIFEGREDSLSCQGLVSEGIYLRNGFRASGNVELGNIKNGGDLDCNNGLFEAGLNAQNAVVDRGVWLRDGFKANKTVAIRNAIIGGNLECEGGTFADPNIAFIANRAKIGGNVDFGKANAKGTIALTGTEIGGDFTPQGAVLEGSPALQLRNSKINGTLFWRSLKFVNGEVDFGGASCTTINMDGSSWMRKRPEYLERNPRTRVRILQRNHRHRRKMAKRKGGRTGKENPICHPPCQLHLSRDFPNCRTVARRHSGLSG